MLRFRLRPTSGAAKVMSIDKEKTLRDLLAMISRLVDIPARDIVIKVAFPPPPKVLDLSNPDLKLISIKSLPSGTSLIVENKSATTSSPAEKKDTCEEKKDANVRAVSRKEALMSKRTIPSDNSCLFNSVAYALENKAKNKSEDMRALIAGIVLSDPLTWNKAILGIPNEAYVSKIVQSNTWGGSIELNILAANYKCEIAAWDVTSKKCNIFGEGSGYKQRIHLLYDGVHYDVLAQNLDGPQGARKNDITIFDPNDHIANIQAASICENHHTQKQFTNVYTYKIKCNICQMKMRGNDKLKSMLT